jgi:hypothetical protein
VGVGRVVLEQLIDRGHGRPPWRRIGGRGVGVCQHGGRFLGNLNIHPLSCVP